MLVLDFIKIKNFVVRRKALVELFKREKIANSKLFVSNDYSQKVLKLRREKMTQLRQLESKGKNAFFVYPAMIKVREAINGVVRDASGSSAEVGDLQG